MKGVNEICMHSVCMPFIKKKRDLGNMVEGDDTKGMPQQRSCLERCQCNAYKQGVGSET